MLHLYVDQQCLLVSIGPLAVRTCLAFSLLDPLTSPFGPPYWLYYFFPLLEEALDFVDSFTESLNLFSELEHILFSDFVEEEAFPKLIVVVSIWVIWLAFRGGNAKVLAYVIFGVGFEFLDSIEDLHLYLGDPIVKLGLL